MANRKLKKDELMNRRTMWIIEQMLSVKEKWEEEWYDKQENHEALNTHDIYVFFSLTDRTTDKISLE